MRQATLGSATADAVLQTAIQMEELGKDFYDAFGVATSDPHMAELCRKLVIDESNHGQVFRRIRSELAAQGGTVLLRDDQLAEARQVAKDAILPNRDEVRRVVCEGRVADLLEIAIQIERDSIRFYRGIAVNLPDGDVVEAVVRQEQDHLRLLSAVQAGEEASA